MGAGPLSRACASQVRPRARPFPGPSPSPSERRGSPLPRRPAGNPGRCRSGRGSPRRRRTPPHPPAPRATASRMTPKRSPTGGGKRSTYWAGTGVPSPEYRATPPIPRGHAPSGSTSMSTGPMAARVQKQTRCSVIGRGPVGGRASGSWAARVSSRRENQGAPDTGSADAPGGKCRRRRPPAGWRPCGGSPPGYYRYPSWKVNPRISSVEQLELPFAVPHQGHSRGPTPTQEPGPPTAPVPATPPGPRFPRTPGGGGRGGGPLPP